MSSGPPPYDPAAAAAVAAAKATRDFTTEAWTLLATGVLVTILRTYSRVRAVGFKRLQGDDYLAWLGPEYALSLSRVLGSRIQIAGRTVYSCLLWTLKASLLVFYMRLTLKRWTKVGFVFLFGGGIFVVACATLRCVLIVTDPVNGSQLAGSRAVHETFVATVTTNLPMIFPLLKA
ncbi:hypothetical protein ACO1O0_002373 [Amphichorda felina]